MIKNPHYSQAQGNTSCSKDDADTSPTLVVASELIQSKISRWERVYSCRASRTLICCFLSFARMMRAIWLSLIAVGIGQRNFPTSKFPPSFSQMLNAVNPLLQARVQRSPLPLVQRTPRLLASTVLPEEVFERRFRHMETGVMSLNGQPAM